MSPGSTTRSVLLPGAVALLVLLSGCAGALQTAPAASDADGPTIAATGVGEATADPDAAVVRVSVVARADAAEAARADAATRVNDLLAALDDAGVPEEDVATTGFSLRQGTDREGDPTGFVAVHSLRVDTTPDAAGAVVDAVVGASEASVDSVRFTLSEAARADLRAEALGRAVEAARADADAVGDTAGLTVTGVRTAATGGGVGPYGAEAAFDERAGSATTFQPGPVTVTATVSITYDAD